MVNLVIEIDGRKAIPVRALPWMTDWHFGALEVAEALSGDGCEAGISFATSYCLETDGSKYAMPEEFWVGVTQRLERAEDAEPPDTDWHAIATKLLPEGVWVWADEWATSYDNSPDGPGQLELIAETKEDLKDVESRRIKRNPRVPPELLPMLLAGFKGLAGLAEPEAEPAPQVVSVTDLAEFEVGQAPQAVPLSPPAEPALQSTQQVAPVAQTEANFVEVAAVPVVALGIETAPAKQPESTHRRTRRNVLTPTIEKAVNACDGRTDAAEVFNKLREWASETPPRHQPLMGVTPDGIQWLDSNDKAKELSRDALAKRLKPRQ